MSAKTKQLILEGLGKSSSTPTLLEEFNLKTNKKNQLLAFFKPEVFLDKTADQTEKILELAFNKLEKHGVYVDGSALYPGPAIGKYKIMDKHYGVINTLSKNASKILSKDERDLVFGALGIKDSNTKILGGHEAFELSKMGKTYEFDKYWLESPSTKIKSGFYVRSMKVGDENVVVVNGFHPHQLAHYTENGRNLAVMLVSSDSPWQDLRVEMLGETFPEKALPNSLRGELFRRAKEFGFEKVGIENNIMHLSAGPTEALFEMDNFLKESFGKNIIEEGALLASLLKKEGFTNQEIQDLLTDKALHGELEHKDTEEAIKIIKAKKGK